MGAVTAADLLFLAVAGVVAGVVSTVASLASVVSYPALLAVGLPPLAANVTNTVAIVATGIGAAAGSRPELRGQTRRVAGLAALTACGGATGAALLLLSPPSAFAAVAPWLIAGASLVLLLQPRLVRGVPTGDARRRARRQHALLYAVAIYAGYFGAAGGILMIAVLAPLLAQPLASVAAVKNVLAGAANAVAAVAFALFAPVAWLAALPLAAGFLVGGWIGPSIVRRLPTEAFRLLVALSGLLAALWLGLSDG